ncbi:MAG: ferritin family protein [Clostridiaceae bacterium]|nr:ferritin family protein [Clostridiaceae bacterium]
MDRLAFAIRLETEGEAFYTQQAEEHKDNPLGSVFHFLAEAEKKHAALLRDRLEGLALEELPDEEPQNLFERFGERMTEPGMRAGQIDVYRTAVVIEQKSIELYSDMQSGATTPDDKKLLAYLIKQEQTHLALFENLEALLLRSQEWVESAEFGTREEY